MSRQRAMKGTRSRTIPASEAIVSFSDGETARKAGHPWNIQGDYDREVNAILDRVDQERALALDPALAERAERGRVDYLLKEKLGKAERRLSRGVDFEIVATPLMAARVDEFIERLVGVMTTSPADGALTATRAYVILRPLQMRLKRENTGKAHLSMTREGSSALMTELESFLGVRPGFQPKGPLGEFYAALKAAKRSMKGRR